MLILKKVALTGGLSCGKSSVLSLFKEFGAKVVSADQIVHQLLSPRTLLGQKVIQLLGPDIVDNDCIDRAAVAKKVFNQPILLQSLEKLLHPAVYATIESQYQRLKNKGETGLFVAEIPLLYESETPHQFDATIAVTSPEALCIERFKQSTGYGEEEFHRRMSRQINLREKARRADYVIQNDGTLDDLRRKVLQIYNQLTI